MIKLKKMYLDKNNSILSFDDMISYIVAHDIGKEYIIEYGLVDEIDPKNLYDLNTLYPYTTIKSSFTSINLFRERKFYYKSVYFLIKPAPPNKNKMLDITIKQVDPIFKLGRFITSKKVNGYNIIIYSNTKTDRLLLIAKHDISALFIHDISALFITEPLYDTIYKNIEKPNQILVKRTEKYYQASYYKNKG